MLHLNDIEYQNKIETLKSKQEIIELDIQLAHFLCQFYPSSDELLVKKFHFLMIWLSVELRSGHVCLDFNNEDNIVLLSSRFDKNILDQLSIEFQIKRALDWLAPLLISAPQLISDGSSLTPLVFDCNRLYFQRLWKNEQIVAHFFHRAMSEKLFELQPEKITQILNQLFEPSNEEDLQKEAVKKALSNKLTIISGGPGTGKTTTVAKFLAALSLLEPTNPISIGIATPTGKASARLTSSVNTAIENLKIDEKIKHRISLNAVTLHKLLGAKPYRNEFKYNAENPLPFDVILIDEASMIDLSMMVHLISALKANSRLILLGDKDQLASVEAGAIFNDICMLHEIKDPSSQNNLKDTLCFLQKSYRFNDNSGIKKWAELVNQGQVEQTLALFKAEKEDIIWHNTPFQDKNQAEFIYQNMITQLAHGYKSYFEAINQFDSPDETKKRELIQKFDLFRILVAFNKGDFGVEILNKQVQKKLEDKKLIKKDKSKEWFNGRPILIKENNSFLNLFNGDIGITWIDENEKPKVYFLLPNNQLKSVPISTLPTYETAFVMTIHKSQGSEFDHIAIVLPDVYQPLLTRSLLYTAITRAKKQVELYSSKIILEETIKAKQQRQSGLSQLLSHLLAPS